MAFSALRLGSRLGGQIEVQFVVGLTKQKLNPLAPMVPLFALLLKESASIVKSMRILDANVKFKRLLTLFAADAKKIKRF